MAKLINICRGSFLTKNCHFSEYLSAHVGFICWNGVSAKRLSSRNEVNKIRGLLWNVSLQWVFSSEKILQYFSLNEDILLGIFFQKFSCDDCILLGIFLSYNRIAYWCCSRCPKKSQLMLFVLSCVYVSFTKFNKRLINENIIYGGHEHKNVRRNLGVSYSDCKTYGQ